MRGFFILMLGLRWGYVLGKPPATSINNLLCFVAQTFFCSELSSQQQTYIGLFTNWIDLTFNMKKTEPFTWFDPRMLLQDQSYLSVLSLQLKFADTIKLSEVLKDCTDILLEKRDGIKNYNNKRKYHIDQDVLNTFPLLSKKIKNLCKTNSIEWCVQQVGFNVSSIKFPFEIDLLDLMSSL